MLHVTNGDAAAELIRRAGVAGAVLPWRDVLHEGPVPAGLSLDALRPVRAGFIAECGWGDYATVLAEFERRDAALRAFRDHDEVVLWFEHDLYDQLQLIQLLDYFAARDPGTTRLSLIRTDQYLGILSPDGLRGLFPDRRPVTKEMLDIGRTAWQAFRSENPTDVAALLRADTSALPFLAGALHRHLEDFPSVENGLARTERQALTALADDPRSLADAFRSCTEQEERRFLGDAVFAWIVEQLSRPPHPLVVFEDGETIIAPRGEELDRALWRRRAVLTDTGRAVLAGMKDRVACCGIDRWRGGVHLNGGSSLWRWDASQQQLQRYNA